MKKLKYGIFFTILFMTIGIAAVSSNLLINGFTPIASNIDDFSVYFSNVLVDGEQDLSLIRNDTSLYFDFEFDELGETKVITYDVTNASKYYDAEVDITCTQSTEYLTISNNFDTDSYLFSRSTRSGVLTLTLSRTLIYNDLHVSVRCSINVSALERNSQESANIPDIPVRKFNIGEEVIIGSEKFNVISDNGDTISMLAQQNIGVDNKQTVTENYVSFSDKAIWLIASGPSEINVQSYGGESKILLNNYVSYLQSFVGDSMVNGDFITLFQLKDLGCTISDDYSWDQSVTCVNSLNYSWLINGQRWWTHSAVPLFQFLVWIVAEDGLLSADVYDGSELTYGIRPVITISKDFFNSKIIEFTIDGTTYYAEEGMYWSEWVDSEYNTSGYVIFQDDNNFRVMLPSSIYHVNDSTVYDTIICENREYVSTYEATIL